jgi:diguanylate cyclase (GGDEF)-like protein
MHALLIGLAAALALCVVAVLALFAALARRASGRADERVTTVVGTLEQRMEELARELTAAVERAEEETRRSRFLNQIGATMDLDDVLAATLEAATSFPGVDGALVRLDAHGGDQPVAAAVGLGDEEPDVAALFGDPADWGARAVELSYRYAEGESTNAVRAALGVPLVDRDDRIGWLGVFSRDPETRFGDDDLRKLEELAERVSPALENARRFREARQLADLDSLTGLHNRRYFHETLDREVARAHRYSRQLSLVLADIDDFKEINDRIGHLAGDAVLAETAQRVRQVVRAADVACRVGGDELAVIVPESGIEDARRLVARMQHAVSSQPVARAGGVRISAGVATLQPQDDSTSLFERADESLYATKNSRKSGGGLAAAD